MRGSTNATRLKVISMNISIRHLRAFIAVAESSSFVEASDVLNCSQPALSVTIRNLEDEIGGRLFVRSTRSVVLTPEGADFLPTARRLIKEFSSALTDVQNQLLLKRGRLNIAAIPSFSCGLLGKIIKEFRLLFPQVDVSLLDTHTEELVHHVHNGRVEFGVTFAPSSVQGLDFTSLFTDEFEVLFSPDNPLAKHFSGNAMELENEDFILLQAPSSIRYLILERLKAHGLNKSPVFECDQLATVGQMVANNVGISIIPSLAKRHMEALGCICKPLNSPQISQSLGILKRTRQPLSRASIEFIKLLKVHKFGI